MVGEMIQFDEHIFQIGLKLPNSKQRHCNSRFFYGSSFFCSQNIILLSPPWVPQPPAFFVVMFETHMFQQTKTMRMFFGLVEFWQLHQPEQ